MLNYSVARSRVLALILTAYFVLASFPSAPRVRGAELDESWVLGLNMARAQGFVAGRDLAFTYGPLGWLRFPDPAAGALAPCFVYRFGLWLVFAFALGRLALAVRGRYLAGWVVLALGASALCDVSRPDLLEFALASLALAAFVDEQLSSLELAALAVLGGLAAMVKLNIGVEALALLVATAAALMTWRWLAAFVALFAGSTAAFYFGATGRLAALFDYVRNGWEIVRGYSVSMAVGGPPRRFVFALLALAALVAGIPAIASKRPPLLRGWVPAAILAFLAFKLAMVRQDGHVLGYMTDLAVASLFLLVCAAARRETAAIVSLQMGLLALSVAITAGWPPLLSRVGQRFLLASAKTAITAYAEWPRTIRELLAADRTGRERQRLGPSYHAAIGTGSVDAYPIDIAVVRANGWRWQARPTLQSCTAYTPRLDRLDAEHFAGSRAPDFILLDWFAIDGRHPFLEEPLTWRTMLARYRLTSAGPGPLLLARGPAARPALQPLGASLTVRWDEPLRLPAHTGILAARAEIARTVYGSARSLLYRLDPVFLDVTYSTGGTRRWRTVWPNLGEGFIVDPLPRGCDEFARLGGRVDSVAFHTPSPAQFRDVIRVAWFEWR